jgi:quinoprotein glucose dehydrogenase
MKRRTFLTTASAAMIPVAHAATSPEKEWRWYGGDAGAMRYSACDQIKASNASKLKVAWVHRTGDASQRPATTSECTPLVVDGVMYITTPMVRVRALDAATGQLKWAFDPQGGSQARRAPGVNRGVCYWQQGRDKRIFATYRDQLLSIDANTGELDQKFGNKGVVDLKDDFDHDMTNLSFRHTSPVVVFEDTVITGGGGGEGPFPEAPGHIRGYDARTGKRRWIFHTVPKPGEFGNDTWEDGSWEYTGGTNCWAGMSLDVKRGIVYAGIGSPAFDFYGGNRKGANLFGNSVLALDARTGKRVWHFQTIHHDIWDWDLPAQPALITMRQGGRTIDATVQVTKQGFVFFFDRQTGKPLFPVEERPVPQSEVPGEKLWPTQPHALKPPPVSHQGLSQEIVTNIGPENTAHVKALLENYAHGFFQPTHPEKGNLIHPGFRGGALWGGCCFDPKRNLLIVPSAEWTSRIKLRPAEPDQPFKYGLAERGETRDHERYPLVKPPWAHLTAIDCDKGDFRWRVVLGTYPELKARGIEKSGALFFGGAICTGGGVVFIGATEDRMMRAFSSDTGETLWETQLEAGGYATPCSYEANGKQYVVIAAAGGHNAGPSSDEFIAYSL